MLLSIALLAATLSPYTIQASEAENTQTCQQTCLAYADEPGYELQACIANCLKQK